MFSPLKIPRDIKIPCNILRDVIEVPPKVKLIG